MRIYWTKGSIPELAGLPADEQGRKWREGYLRAFGHWQMWASVGTIALCSAIGSYVGVLMGSQLLGGVVGAAVGGFIHGVISTELVRRHLRATTSAQAGVRSGR